MTCLIHSLVRYEDLQVVNDLQPEHQLLPPLEQPAPEAAAAVLAIKMLAVLVKTSRRRIQTVERRGQQQEQRLQQQAQQLERQALHIKELQLRFDLLRGHV